MKGAENLLKDTPLSEVCSGGSSGNALVTVEQQEQVLAFQQSIFSDVMSGQPVVKVLDHLCLLAEQLLPNSVASFMVQDSSSNSLRVLSAPSVPVEGHQALSGLQIGPGSGSCGNAVLRNEAVYVRDTFTDDRWQDLRQLAYDFNLCACWSIPVRNASGEAIGSFALSSFEHRLPSSFHKRILQVGADMAGLVLARQQQDEYMAEQNRRLQLLGHALESASEGIVITDANNRILDVNPFFEKITGYSCDEVVGLDPILLSSDKDNAHIYDAMWHGLLTHNHWSGEVVNRRKDGSLSPQWLSISVVRDGAGKVQNYIGIFTDLSDIRKERDRHLAALTTDTLTGLPNKSQLQEALNHCHGDSALLVLNVNNFSLINSAYGLDFADRLLAAITQRLQRVLAGARIYRLNADEFAIHYEKDVFLKSVFNKIRENFFLQQIQVDSLNFNISFSYGGAVGHDDLIRKALMALKKAKQGGRGRFYLYADQRDELEQHQRLEYMQWNALLHRALSEDCLVPYFQGIRDNQTGNISYYECLIRMQINGQVYGPYQFLEPAKLSGLLPVITRIVIDKSCRAMSSNRCEFAINITEDDLSHQYLEAYLAQKCAQYDIAPERITLEILEGVSADGKKNHIKQLATLKAKGFRLAIDDFGTEYSNFERILELDVDVIKIDAKYIKSIDTDKTSYEITRAIVFFAQNAGIPVVAEFVHSESVQRVVDALGIRFSQGYLFSEPAPDL
ncbi:sensor domain-containing diguanylate cyclase [Oceanospirillum linum]|uniref:sensor domain-containing diguanylate cyclase n=1 Tax=Oceanospirillum linum TaxID=966 RepID=UPI00089EE7E9|nr:EAL domain-containing protein [Oceanospirillum linum]SEF48435.1 PAS domain S-box-containing protein/diguanylate cyclase (GGDEF) domain-containing protein [Oleiphilus messinensis]SMP02895.1 PAS domain S-box-containing protein/diguanylate cyclase (GGDEF) domain-containing protein [Oceanospirillum linum]